MYDAVLLQGTYAGTMSSHAIGRRTTQDILERRLQRQSMQSHSRREGNVREVMAFASINVGAGRITSSHENCYLDDKHSSPISTMMASAQRTLGALPVRSSEGLPNLC